MPKTLAWLTLIVLLVLAVGVLGLMGMWIWNAAAVLGDLPRADFRQVYCIMLLLVLALLGAKQFQT